MTLETFFGAIEDNLKMLADQRAPLPRYNLSWFSWGRRRFRQFVCLEKDWSEKKGFRLRVYDLVSTRLPLTRARHFRVFAVFCEQADLAAYEAAKQMARHWYRQSGYDRSVDKPFAGAMVLGSGTAWAEDAQPVGERMPFENMVYQLLVAPGNDGEDGLVSRKLGEASGKNIFRALVPESYEGRRQRVRQHVESALAPSSGYRGHVTVAKVARAMLVPPEEVVDIFKRMQAEGTVRIEYVAKRNSDGTERSIFERMHVEKGCPSWWSRMTSSCQ